LIVDVGADHMVITPMAAAGGRAELAELIPLDPAGSPVAVSIVIDRE
jgi:hypothetical protein